MDRHKILIKKTSSAIYAQLMKQGIVLVSKRYVFQPGDKPADQSLGFGRDFAKLVIATKVKSICFDRGDRKYHGNVRAFAEGLRKGGLEL